MRALVTVLAALPGAVTTRDGLALAADLWAAYCGAMVTWAIDGTGTLPDWIAAHLERILAPYRTYAKQTTPDGRHQP